MGVGEAGHALTVQCNPKTGMFRFFDDNLASFDFDSKDAFVKHFIDYLEKFYPKSTIYYVLFTALKS